MSIGALPVSHISITGVWCGVSTGVSCPNGARPVRMMPAGAQDMAARTSSSSRCSEYSVCPISVWKPSFASSASIAETVSAKNALRSDGTMTLTTRDPAAARPPATMLGT